MIRVTLAAVLIAVQAAVLLGGIVWGRTAPDYRATYIDHTMDCWLAEPPARVAARDFAGAARIVPKDLSLSRACALLPQGWNAADQWGVWSAGNVARILVPFRPQDRRATLWLRGYAPNRAQHVVLAQPGLPDRSIDIPPGQTVAAAIDRPATDDAVVPITLRIADIHDPLDADIADWRAIGVALIAVTRDGAPADK
jgi:hypothetical protein